MIPATGTLTIDIPLGRVDATDQITDTATGTMTATLDHPLAQVVTTTFTIKMKGTEVAGGSLDQTEDHPDQDLTTKEYHHRTTVAVEIVDQILQVQTVLFTITTLPFQEDPLITHVAMREKPSNNWAPDRGSARSSFEDLFLQVRSYNAKENARTLEISFVALLITGKYNQFSQLGILSCKTWGTFFDVIFLLYIVYVA